MKITKLAARLRPIAANMEVLAIREGDLDYPDEMMLPFIVNVFTDQTFCPFPSLCIERLQRRINI